jgi:Domain of unknown function (DUF4375)
MPRRAIQKSQAINDPTIIWNTFVDLISEQPQNLDPEQRPVHFVLIYDAEVQNGGHLQYFFNYRNEHLEETLSALTLVGAACQREILKEAATLFESRPRKSPETAQEYSTIALLGEFDSFDKRFHECSPALGELLGKHLTEHASTYIDLI